jgi:hypothetical protein
MRIIGAELEKNQNLWGCRIQKSIHDPVMVNIVEADGAFVGADTNLRAGKPGFDGALGGAVYTTAPRTAWTRVS